MKGFQLDYTMVKNLLRKKTRGLLLKALGGVVLIIGVKLLAHAFGWELISLNALFSGIIGANVFLLGFLMSGVLSDFKESEKIPGDLASIFYTIADELDAARLRTGDPMLDRSREGWLKLAAGIHAWLHKSTRTSALMSALRGLYADFAILDGIVQPNAVTRLKQEHHALRKLIIRMHTIRETDFISSGYLIAVTTSGLMFAGLVLAKIEPYYESLFIVGVICYLMIFLILLIRDLDNPFGYYENSSGEDVSLKPLEDVIADMRERMHAGTTSHQTQETL